MPGLVCNNECLHQNYISAYIENSRDAQLFALHEIVSEYATILSILAHKEKTSKENKLTWRLRQWYFPIFSLYANRHKLEQLGNFSTNKKCRDPSSSFHERWDGGKKLSQATVPLI